MLTVGLRGARFTARHGVFAEEAILGGEFEVDIACTLSDGLEAGTSDDLVDTLDYGTLLHLAAAAMEEPAALLETVLARIVEAVRLRAGAHLVGMEIEVRKLHPPLPGRPGVAWVRWVE